MPKNATESTELITHILNAESPYEQELYRDLLLAGECLTSGIRVDSELRQVILTRLLSLYRRKTAFESTATPQSFIVRRIEAIISSLGDADRAEIATSLLAIAKGERQAEPVTLGKTVANLAIAVQEFLYVLLESLHDLESFRDVIFFRTYLKEMEAREASSRRYDAIKALGNLNLQAPETTPVLLAALEDVSTRGVAAEVLGKLGPGGTEVAMALVSAQLQHRRALRWDSTVDKIIEALGILGQRSSDVAELLLDLTKDPEADSWNRYAATYALCKSAETDPRAAAFVVEGRPKMSATQPTSDSEAGKPLDEPVCEGLKDGRDLINSASPAVIRYLLDVMRNSDLSSIFNAAGGFLAQVAGDTPLVQCKTANKDGSFRHSALDLTEEMFAIFLSRPIIRSYSNIALSLLVEWGLSRPDLTVRLINTVREADTWLLGGIIEGWIDKDEMLEPRLPIETIAFFKQSAERLRSPHEAVREAELTSWLAEARSASEDNWRLAGLSAEIERVKALVLHQAYRESVPSAYEQESLSLSRQLPGQAFSPYVIAALACFRGWGSVSLLFRLKVEYLQEEILSEVDQAISILQTSNGRTVEILASILAGEGPRLVSSDLERNLEALHGKELARWHKESKPDVHKRTAAAYALAQLSDERPEAQRALVSNLKPHFWKEEQGSFPENRVQEHLVRALGYVRHASHDVVEALFEIMSKPNGDSCFVSYGSQALSQLRNPSTEAVTFLIEGYGKLDERRQADIIKVLGTVEPTTEEIVCFLLRTLDKKSRWLRSAVARALGNIEKPYAEVRSAAAIVLGDLGDPNVEVLDALLDSVRDNAPAAEAIGKIAGRLPLADGMETQSRLDKAAQALEEILRSAGPQYFYSAAGRGGKDVVRQALDRVVARLVEAEVAALGPEPPSVATIPAETRAAPALPIALGILIATLSGMASNIVAAYLQDSYHLITDAWRFGIVMAVFVLTVVASIWLTLRQEKKRAEAPERR